MLNWLSAKKGTGHGEDDDDGYAECLMAKTLGKACLFAKCQRGKTIGKACLFAEYQVIQQN